MNLLAPLSDKANALEALGYCAAVYLSAQISTADAHANIIVLDNCILIIFRGSKSAQDWLADADFLPTECDYGTVHSGIWHSYTGIAPLISQKLNDLPALPIVVLGHSLGGLQAKYFARDLCDHWKIARVITFGCPAGGHRDWQANYDAALKEITVSFVDGLDIVPRIPPEALGYFQCGTYALLPSKGGLEIPPSSFEIFEEDITESLDDITHGRFNGELAAHHLDNYKARILAL